MKKIVLLLVLTMLLLSSCVTRYSIEKDTVNETMTEDEIEKDTVTSVETSDIPETNEDIQEYAPTEVPENPGIYNSKEKFIYGDFVLDLGDGKNFNSRGELFLPNTAKQPAALPDMGDDYYKDITEEQEENAIENQVVVFLEALKNIDISTLAYNAGIGYIESNMMERIYAYLKNIKITDYGFTKHNPGKSPTSYAVYLDIAESDNPRYPVGRSYWRMYSYLHNEISVFPFFIPADEYPVTERDFRYSTSAIHDMSLDFSFELLNVLEPEQGITTPQEFDFSNMADEIYHMIAKAYEQWSEFPISTVDRFFNEFFGLSQLPRDLIEEWLNKDKYQKYLENPDEALFGCPGHGWSGHASRILATDYDEKTKTKKVLYMQFSDHMQMKPSKIIEFTFKQGSTEEVPQLISINLAYSDGNHIARYTF